MAPVIESLPEEWEIIVWSNGGGFSRINRVRADGHVDGRQNWPGAVPLPDLAVYGRYAAIKYAAHDVCYTQDDDVIVSDPQAIVDGLIENYGAVVSTPFAFFPGSPQPPVTHVEMKMGTVVCNMPQEFRHDAYTDSALVGFGAAFHRDAPKRAFDRFLAHSDPYGVGLTIEAQEWFWRTCDVMFTTLTDRVLVDVPKVNREFAEDADRMYRQPDHVGERARMLTLARQARDA